MVKAWKLWASTSKCFLVLLYSFKHVPDVNCCTSLSFHHTKRSKSRIRSDFAAASKSCCARWYSASSASSSTPPSGTFTDNTKSTFLLSIRKTAKRTWTTSGTRELNLRTSWLPWRTIGEGVLSPLAFGIGIVATLSIELDVAELSSAKELKWNLGNRCRLFRQRDGKTTELCCFYIVIFCDSLENLNDHAY